MDVGVLDQCLQASLLLKGGDLVHFTKGAEDHVEGVEADQAVGLWSQGQHVSHVSGSPRVQHKHSVRVPGRLTARSSRDTSSTLEVCSAADVEFVICPRVEYCRYTVLPRTCFARTRSTAAQRREID